jgi:Icc-related predicted phosphoesterase
MKILLVSDTHNHHPQIYEEDLDFLIHVGDSTNTGSRREFEHFAEWWESVNAKHRLYIPGNHEVFYFRELREKGRDAVKDWLPSDVKVLINEAVELEGLKFYGSPNTAPIFKDKLYWAWEEFDAEREKIFNGIPTDLDFLLTHTPPFGVLDQVPGDGSVGCKFLKEIVERVKPRYHIFGHIHEQGGNEVEINGTTYINVATRKRILEI